MAEQGGGRSRSHARGDSGPRQPSTHAADPTQSVVGRLESSRIHRSTRTLERIACATGTRGRGGGPARTPIERVVARESTETLTFLETVIQGVPIGADLSVSIDLGASDTQPDDYLYGMPFGGRRRVRSSKDLMAQTRTGSA